MSANISRPVLSGSGHYVLVTVLMLVMTGILQTGSAETLQPINPRAVSSAQPVGTRGAEIKKYSSAARSFAEHDERTISQSKAQPKTKRIILAVVLISLVVITAVNVLALSDNSRFCTNCHYSGRMKIIALSGNPFFNSLLKFIVAGAPVALYYFSERGRFMCPKCNRTSANVSLRRRE